MLLILFLEINLLIAGTLWFIFKYDKEHGLKIDKKTKWKIEGSCVILSLWIEVFLSHWGVGGKLACGGLAAYLLLASVMDLQICMVYDFLSVFGFIGGVWVLWRIQPRKEQLIALFFFWILQYFFFMKMYGKADGIAFCICALFESCYGVGMLTYLLHMLAAYCVLGVIQGLKHNINKQGNLKQPVPFLPYITGTVWFFLL